MATYFQALHQKLITDLEFNRADLDRELTSWTEKNGAGKESLSRFYRSCLELGESHFSNERFESMGQNRRLRTVYLLMFDLHIKANWSRTSVTRKLNVLNMKEANHHRFKVTMEIIPPGRCQYAEHFRDLQFDLESAMKEFPLDYMKCEREGGCVCTVGFEGVRDENGRLVKKYQ